MKLLITGATGLVGQGLVEKCLQSGWEVNYLTTSQNKIKSDTKGLQGYYWYPLKGYIDKEALKGVQTIVHLAGATIAQRWTKKNRKKIVDSRVIGAQLILDTLARNNIQLNHFVSASAIGCYPSSLTAKYDETFEGCAMGFLGEVVKDWEKAALNFKGIGCKVSIMRTGIVLDPERGALPKIAKPIKFGFGAALGSGKQWQSWIHIEDTVNYYHHVITQNLEGIFNVVAPNPITNRELTKIAAQLLKRPLWLPAVPAFVLKALLGKMATIVLESQYVIPAMAQSIHFSFKYTETAKALKDCIDRIHSIDNIRGN